MMNYLISASTDENLNAAKELAQAVVNSLSKEELTQAIPGWEEKAALADAGKVIPNTMRAGFLLEAYYSAQYAKEALSK